MNFPYFRKKRGKLFKLCFGQLAKYHPIEFLDGLVEQFQ
jgi:hypothetical protein